MSKLFGGKPQAPPPETPVAPVPDDQQEQANQERAYSRRFGNRGRTGTVLSRGNRLG